MLWAQTLALVRCLGQKWLEKSVNARVSLENRAWPLFILFILFSTLRRLDDADYSVMIPVPFAEHVFPCHSAAGVTIGQNQIHIALRAQNHSTEESKVNVKIKQLVYISKATEPFTAASLKDLTAVANTNNAKLNVTGCMAYASGYFLQLLEGDSGTVDSLYRKIANDTRHKGTKLLLEQTVDEDKRLFGKWFMSSFNVDTQSDFPDELKQSITQIIYDRTAIIPVHRLFMEFRKYLG